ncbi:MAG: hypothetical protein WBA77_21675 [Microcoleaceae cyanobacterium]
MSIFSDFLRSLLLTMILSFMTPIFLFVGVLISFTAVGYLPQLAAFGQLCSDQVLQFLAVFGRGNPFEGGLIIGITCSFVGALFDTYASYGSSR